MAKCQAMAILLLLAGSILLFKLEFLLPTARPIPPVPMKSFNFVHTSHWQNYSVIREFQNESNDEEQTYDIKLAQFDASSVNYDILFYPRVPKCGSGTLKKVLRELAPRNGFHFCHTFHYTRRIRTTNEQQRLVKNIDKYAAKRGHIFLDRHVYFINFERFNRSNPIQINIIRDPVRRFISSFQWRRLDVRDGKYHFQFSLVDQEPDLVRENFTFWEWFTKNLTTCVLTNDTECEFRPGIVKESMVSFFCGNHPICLVYGNPMALQRSLYHISKFYFLIGLLENIEGFFQRCTKLLPHFFRNSWQILQRLKVGQNSDRKIHQAREQRFISNNTYAYLRDKMQFEYDLYFFVKQKFHW